MELTEKDKERLRTAWQEMYAHAAESAIDSASPHAKFLATLNEGLRQIQEMENIEMTVKELHERTDALLKRSRKIDDLIRRVDNLAKKR